MRHMIKYDQHHVTATHWYLLSDTAQRTGLRFLFSGGVGFAITMLVTGTAFILSVRGMCQRWGRLVDDCAAGGMLSPIILKCCMVYIKPTIWEQCPEDLPMKNIAALELLDL